MGKQSGSGSRAVRLADQMQRELSEILRLGLKDRRIGLVTITAVELSPDLTHARVFYSVLGSEAQVAETHATLARATGFFRSELAKTLTTRITPELHFVFDESIERGDRLSRLIDAAVRSDSPPDT